MDDYDEAMETNGFGYWNGKSENNEKIMAVSYPVSSKNSDYSARRGVVSLSQRQSGWLRRQAGGV